uniref:Uncharacterized protein n=1 Tax=Anopheles atroparvus TaxID=41427 RepID=A0A182J1K6_ANOAO
MSVSSERLCSAARDRKLLNGFTSSGAVRCACFCTFVTSDCRRFHSSCVFVCTRLRSRSYSMLFHKSLFSLGTCASLGEVLVHHQPQLVVDLFRLLQLLQGQLEPLEGFVAFAMTTATGQGGCVQLRRSDRHAHCFFGGSEDVRGCSTGAGSIVGNGGHWTSVKLYDGYSGTNGFDPIAFVSVSSVMTTAAAFMASSGPKVEPKLNPITLFEVATLVGGSATVAGCCAINGVVPMMRGISITGSEPQPATRTVRCKRYATLMICSLEQDGATVISCSSFMLTPSTTRVDWLLSSIRSGMAWPGTYPVHGTVTRVNSGFVRHQPQQNTRASSMLAGILMAGEAMFRSTGWTTVKPTLWLQLDASGERLTAEKRPLRAVVTIRRIENDLTRDASDRATVPTAKLLTKASR